LYELAKLTKDLHNAGKSFEYDKKNEMETMVFKRNRQSNNL
jgi:hypothetical protein